MAEQLTLNQRVPGSSPERGMILSCLLLFPHPFLLYPIVFTAIIEMTHWKSLCNERGMSITESILQRNRICGLTPPGDA